VMFKKSDILAVGSYENVIYFEDYFLWLKCLKAQYHMRNLHLNGVFVRGGQDMLKRRRGLTYIRHEWNFIYKSSQMALISFSQFIQMIIFRIPTRLLDPSLLRVLYKFLRK
jgi:amylovoran biosynthesis glycosyltransferase AmsE